MTVVYKCWEKQRHFWFIIVELEFYYFNLINLWLFISFLFCLSECVSLSKSGNQYLYILSVYLANYGTSVTFFHHPPPPSNIDDISSLDQSPTLIDPHFLYNNKPPKIGRNLSIYKNNRDLHSD